MYCPFGASKPPPEQGKPEPPNPQWAIQMSFGDDAACQTFQQRAIEFDEMMLDEGSKPDNCVNWLGAPKNKPYSREVVETKYFPMVKYVKKNGEVTHEYPPFIRPNFPSAAKAPYEFTCEVYDKNNQPLLISPDPNSPNFISKMIPPGCICSALIAAFIWCNSANGFGATWRIVQLKVFPPKGLPKGVCQIDDPEEEDEQGTGNGDNDDANNGNGDATGNGEGTGNGDGTGEKEDNGGEGDGDGDGDGEGENVEEEAISDPEPPAPVVPTATVTQTKTQLSKKLPPKP